MSSADIQGVYKEYIHPNLEETYEQVFPFFKKLKSTKTVDVSGRASRFEFETAPGGVSGYVDHDGGAVPIGDNNLVVEALVSTIGIDFSRSITDKMDWATDSEKKAITKIHARLVRTALQEMSQRMDIAMQGNGSGVRAVLLDAATDTPPQYRVAITGNPAGTMWLREGEAYDVIAAAAFPGTIRAGGPYYIAKDGGILAETQDITTTAVITAAAALDRLVVHGAAQGDFHGLAYLISDAITGTFQNITRAKPYVQARSVDAGGAVLDWTFIRAARSKIFKRMGKIPSGLIPYCGPDQQDNYEAGAQAISQLPRGTSSQKFDMMLDEGTIQGKAVMINPHADPTLFYYLNMEDFIRLEMKKMDFLTTNGEYIYRLYSAPSGGGTTGPIHKVGFTLCYNAQLALKRPPVNMSYIKNLAVPSTTVGTNLGPLVEAI